MDALRANYAWGARIFSNKSTTTLKMHGSTSEYLRQVPGNGIDMLGVRDPRPIEGTWM
jgi:hypothetical protein